MYLGDVEGVEDEDVMVVLGEGHHVALAGDLQAAASRHLENMGLEKFYLLEFGVYRTR